MGKGSKPLTTVRSQQGQQYDLHVSLTGFPRLREQSNPNSSTCSRANISHAQNTLLYDSHNQTAACESQKQEGSKKKCPKGSLVLLYHNKKILEASEVLNLGTRGCGCARTGLAVIESFKS